MNAATTLNPTSVSGPANTPRPVFHSAMFQAPGRPRPLARRLAIHNRVMHSIRKFMAEQKFNEVPVSYAPNPAQATVQSSRQTGYRFLEGMVAQGFPAVWCEGEQDASETNDPASQTLRTGFKIVQASLADTTINELADLLETLVKSVAETLGADLLGGRHITRLDRMLGISHPRFSYHEALEIANQRGFDLQPGDTIPTDALATLTRYANNQPFILTNLPSAGASFSYVFPFCGILGHGFAHGTAGKPSGSFTLEVAPLLQYFMGLSSIKDAVIQPLGAATSPSLNAQRGNA